MDIFDQISPDVPARQAGGDIFDRLAPAPADKPSFMQRLASGPVGDVVSSGLDILAAPVETAMGVVGGTVAGMAKPLVAAGANIYSAVTGGEPRSTERAALDVFDKVAPYVAYQPQSKLAKTALDVAAAPFAAGKAGLESAGVPEEYAGPLVETAGLALPFLMKAARGIFGGAKTDALARNARMDPKEFIRQARESIASEPDVVRAAQRARDFETAIGEVERVAQSPKGADLLRRRLLSEQEAGAAEQAAARAQPIFERQAGEAFQAPSREPVEISARRAAIEDLLKERDVLKQSRTEYELLKRRLAAEEARSKRITPETPISALFEENVSRDTSTIAPGSTIEPTAIVGQGPVSGLSPGVKPGLTARQIKGPSIEKAFGGYLSDLKISLDKTNMADRDELFSLAQSPLGKKVLVKDARPNSVSLQEAVERAYQDGYIPSETLDDFLEAVDKTLSGQKVYSTKSQVFERVSKAGQVKLDAQAMEGAADAKIRDLASADAPVEFAGKTYTRAVKEGNNLRLKDTPDKVLTKAGDILKAEEKIPFDIPLRPTFEQTAAGKQAVMPGAEGRTVPNAPLRAKRAQSEAPIELEQPGIRAKEPELFKIKEAPEGYGQPELAGTRQTQPLSDLLKTPGGMTKVSLYEQAPRRSDVLYARRTGIPSSDVAGLNVGDVVYDDLLGRYGKVAEKYKDAVRVVEGKDNWTIGAGNRLRGAEIIGQQGELGLAKETSPVTRKPGSLVDILKSEKGSVPLGPVRMREGKPVEAPTVAEVEKAVKDLTEPVSAARLIRGGLSEESSRTLSKTMGAEGTELARLSKAIRNDSELEASGAYQPIKEQLKTLTKDQRGNLVDVLDGRMAPVDEIVRAAATTARIELNKVADRAAAVGLEIKNPVTGEKTPFQPRENFFPHMFGKELRTLIADPKGRAEIKAQIKTQMERAGKEVTDTRVEKALEAMIRVSRQRYGHLEMARIFDVGGYSKDAGAVLSRYFNDAYRRINIAEKFGPDLAKGESLLSEIGVKKGDKAESFARSYFQKVTSTEPEGNLVVKDAVTFATNFQAFSKLGQAVIPNLSQPTYTAIVTGAKNAAKGYASALTTEGRGWADKIILSDTMTDFLKDTGAHLDQSTMGRGADAVLRYTGFSASERLNRAVAANAGKYFAEETFGKLVKKPDNARLRQTLEKMSVDVEAALERGELSDMDKLRAGQNIVNRTQFKTDVTEIPLFWASDAGRLLTQFKKFQFKAGQMVKDEILKEMAHGNVKPFVRAAAILPVAGVLVTTAKDAIRFGPQTERDRNLADYLAAVGTFGAFTDAFASSGRQPVKGLQYLAGPTLGDFGAAWEAAFIEAPRGNLRPAAKFVARQIPVVGPSIRNLFNEPKAAGPNAELNKLLKEMGLSAHSQGNQKMMKDLGLRP